jgi:hypothetical protein
MPESIREYGLVFLFLTIVVGKMVWRGRRLNTVLTSWAATNNLDILSRRRGWFRQAPSF